MAHRKWKETKQHPGTAGPGNMLGSCLVSFYILWAILCPQAVHLWKLISSENCHCKMISHRPDAAVISAASIKRRTEWNSYSLPSESCIERSPCMCGCAQREAGVDFPSVREEMRGLRLRPRPMGESY